MDLPNLLCNLTLNHKYVLVLKGPKTSTPPSEQTRQDQDQAVMRVCLNQIKTRIFRRTRSHLFGLFAHSQNLNPTTLTDKTSQDSGLFMNVSTAKDFVCLVLKSFSWIRTHLLLSSQINCFFLSCNF